MNRAANEFESSSTVSAFLLERYHIGEVTPQEKLHVERTLGESALAASLAELDRADREFFSRFPLRASHKDTKAQRRMKIGGIKPLVWGLSAAALALLLPLFVFRNFIPAGDQIVDRIKGTSTAGYSAELSVYLKGNSAGAEIKLPDQAGIQTGNTVQLAYQIQGDASGERYGVIFSIDGRSSVTLHYPYAPGQSTMLVSGKAVPLEEAYTLDDAPDYEIFFFVIGDKPLETQDILNTAKKLAGKIAGNPQKAERQGSAVFKDHGLKTVTLWKNQQ